MNSFDVDQDQDWPPNCSQSVLCQALDEAAHCSICRDFFNTPLSLLCGHSFCAECIRANIQFQERNSGKAVCPQCREAADSRQIIANHALRDLVNNYLLARPQLIASSGIAAQGPEAQKQTSKPGRRKYATRNGGKKRRISDPESGDTFVIDLDTNSEPEASGRKLRKRKSEPIYYPEPHSDPEGEAPSSSGSGGSQSSDASPAPTQLPVKRGKKSASPSVKQKGVEKAGGTGKLHKNWVECPCCQQNFPMAIFNDHLDGCLQNGGKSESPVNTDSGFVANGKAPKKGKGGKPKLVVPPKLLMAIEKDRALKDRLKRYNLPIKGSRQELEQRYTRFRVEVQTALDRCESGATYASLAKRVITRENSEANASVPAASVRPALVKNPVVAMGNDFDDLIKATRLRSGQHGKSVPALKPATPERDSEGASESQDPKQDEGKEQTSAPGKEASWGRGFRRPSAGGSQRQDTMTPSARGEAGLPDSARQRVDGHPPLGVLDENGAQGPKPSADSREPPLVTHQSHAVIQSQSKQLPWMQEGAALEPRDVIEETEDEEDPVEEEA